MNTSLKKTLNGNSSQLDSSSLNSSQNVYKFKIIILGDVAVGKTSIMNRFVDNNFNLNYHCTICVDFKVKSLKIGNTASANLQIWDTCGQEKYRAITRQYYQSVNGICLVYDLTNKGSFDKIDGWMQEIERAGLKDTVIFLVGNKVDSDKKRTFFSDETKKYALKNNMDYLEVSAKTGKNIIQLFESMTKRMIQLENYKMKNEKTDKIPIKPLSLDVKNNIVVITTEKKDGCC